LRRRGKRGVGLRRPVAFSRRGSGDGFDAGDERDGAGRGRRRTFV
jgi:hypothetical protein